MDNKSIFKHAKKFIGGQTEVFEYYNTAKSKHIDMMINKETAFEEVAVYSTIGLSSVDLGISDENSKPIRVELIGVGDLEDENTANIIATSCFEIMDKKMCYFGMVIPNVVERYVPNLQTKHIILLSPVFWKDYKALESESEIIVWLLCVPITDSEKAYLEKNGLDALEQLLSEQENDITDIYRHSFI